jgi:hypothetical protein
MAAAIGSSMRQTPLVDPLDEVAQHLLGDVEVGDHPVLERAHGLDVGRGAADHALGFVADGQDRAGERVDRDHRWLVQDDAVAPNVDERVRGPEVDSHVLTQEPEDPLGARSSAGGRGKSVTNPLGHRFPAFLQDPAGGGNPRLGVEPTLNPRRGPRFRNVDARVGGSSAPTASQALHPHLR